MDAGGAGGRDDRAAAYVAYDDQKSSGPNFKQMRWRRKSEAIKIPWGV